MLASFDRCRAAELPDPLAFADGRRVKSADDWGVRRGEIRKLVMQYEYGDLAPAPKGVTVTQLISHQLKPSGTQHQQFKVTCDLDEAVEEITTFYRNYHSSRYVNGQLLIRLQRLPSTAMLARLNHDFSDILSQGEIMAAAPPGDAFDEAPHLPRVLLWFNRMHFGRLRQMIDVLNQC